MKETEREQMAIAEVRRVVDRCTKNARVVHCDAECEWDPQEFRTRSDHRMHVLAPGPDIVFFYGEDDQFHGWRDEGRGGAAVAHAVDPNILRKVVVNELGLAETSLLDEAHPAELPPLGWTHEVLLFSSPLRSEDSAVRAWVDPKSMKVIQCLYGQAATAVPA